MANRTSTALLAAIFTIAGAAGAMAQTSQTPAPAPAPAAPAAEAPAPAAPAAPAATGATAPDAAAAQPGQTYAKSTHGDWMLRCMKTADGKDPCELYQLLKDGQGSSVAEASILPLTGNVQAVVTFVAPLETDLQAGLGLQIDTAEARRYPFMLCAPVGCISRLGLTEAEVGAMKRGKSANVSLQPFGGNPEEPVRLSLSLAGFTAGMDALKEANKDLQVENNVPAQAPAAPAPAAPAAPEAPAAPAQQ